MAEANDALCWQAIDQIADGEPYCFVIMGFSLPEEVLAAIGKAVCEHGLKCVRADAVPGAFWHSDRQQKLHTLINRATLIVADISPQYREGAEQVGPSENVYYEIGYAAARAKPMILLAKKDTVSPYNLGGKDLIFYERNAEGYEELIGDLSRHIEIVMSSNARAKLAGFLAPGVLASSLVVVEPKRVPEDTTDPQPPEERTFGDYLGVVGIFRAFGLVFGESNVPELLTASRAAERTVHGDTNLYLIGSNKVNRYTEVYLDALQRGSGPRFTLQQHPDDRSDELAWQLSGGFLPDPWPEDWGTPLRESNPNSEDDREDYGLIIRGPKPRITVTRKGNTKTYEEKPERTVTILAGAHSLGTGAACMAATRSDKIEDIIEKLAGFDLRRTDQTLWVLVKGTSRYPEYHLAPSDVKVVDAGLYAEE